MEPSPKVSSATSRRATARDDHGPEPARAVEVEPDREALRLVEQHRVNLLLVGDDEIVQRLVESLSTRFHQPVGTWSPGEQLVLPPAERTGTMVLRNVGSLALQYQIQLL